MSLNIARPHDGAVAAAMGVLNEKSIVWPATPVESEVIHACDAVSAGPTTAL
jgi:hypothetical protein